MAIENTTPEKIEALNRAQKDFFATGVTLDPKWRKKQLKILLHAMEEWEKPLADALWTDLHKSYKEAYLTELALVKAELKHALKNVRKWSARECRATALSCMPARSYIVKEPLGTSLIIAPWN